MDIITFEIHSSVDGSRVTLYPTLIQLNGKNYLVDCGYEETFDEFVSQLEKNGLAITDLHAILISHDDIDHLGALRLFKEKHPDLLVYSSAVEANSVAGKVKSERLEQAEASLTQLPDKYREWALRFIDDLSRIKRVAVDVVLNDNDCIEQEIRVVSTPGHTKGHISFYAPDERILIAGDAVVIEDGQLNIANPQFTLDLREAVKSVKKLTALRIDRLICYHGGIMEINVHQHLSDLLSNYSDYK